MAEHQEENRVNAESVIAVLRQQVNELQWELTLVKAKQIDDHNASVEVARIAAEGSVKVVD